MLILSPWFCQFLPSWTGGWNPSLGLPSRSMGLVSWWLGAALWWNEDGLALLAQATGGCWWDYLPAQGPFPPARASSPLLHPLPWSGPVIGAHQVIPDPCVSALPQLACSGVTLNCLVSHALNKGIDSIAWWGKGGTFWLLHWWSHDLRQISLHWVSLGLSEFCKKSNWHTDF